jgi:hypothetical protein
MKYIWFCIPQKKSTFLAMTLKKVQPPRDINRFTDLTAKLLATKINGISQVEFGHSKADSLLREADLLAYFPGQPYF